MRLFSLLMAAALVTVVAAPAFAQQKSFVPGGVFALPPHERFVATDKSKDGKVTQDEYKAVLNLEAAQYIAAIWERMDTNRDGWLTEAEMSPSRPGGRPGVAPPSTPVAAAKK